MPHAAGKDGKFGIIVSGGPAPGINSVIASAVIEANKSGYGVIGFLDGFKGAYSDKSDSCVELTIPDVSTIFNSGGSILGSSRFNPFKHPAGRERLVSSFQRHKIDKLIVIGGEGSAFLSRELLRHIPGIKVVHIPKTIDNDLVLANKYPSFGFETALDAGAKILHTLSVDAKTTKSFFLISSMGRKAGFLALGLGLTSGAMLTLIPEEFARYSVTPRDISAIIAAAIKKRFEMKRPYGIIIVAEGVLECIDPSSSDVLQNAPRDEIGRLAYSQVELDDVLMPSLKEQLGELGIKTKINAKNIGYELRCHDPIAFDIEYTKFLGYGAVQLMLQGKSGVIVTRDFDKIGHQDLRTVVPDEGEIITRQVHLDSDLYKVACRFMIR
ncbi:MAG: 6-phosphofructokinase [Deltaproteobacteria bacterium]|nr:6-phosphofructokinase [Deltaproteobacteria bacterium]